MMGCGAAAKGARSSNYDAYENQRNDTDAEDFIRRFRYKATKVCKCRKTASTLEKMKRIKWMGRQNSLLRLSLLQ